MRTSYIRWVLVLIAIVATAPSAAIPARAQGAAAPVLIDFRAVTDDGQPVLDLKASDVTLRVGGKPREITSLELVKVGSAKAAAPAAASSLPAPFSTNARASAPGARRDVLVMIDDEAIGPGREGPVRDALTKLIGALTPGDRVGLLSARPGRLNVAFTTKHEDVTSAIGRITGAAAARESAADYVCRGVMALQSIRGALGMFSPGAAPTFIYVAGALSGPTDDRTLVAGASDLCQLRTRDFEEIGNLAQASHATVYVIHALDTTTVGGGAQAQQAGLDNLAGVTGGEMIRFTGAGEAQLARIASETSAYYLAAFTPEAADRNGQRQRVELRVGRERVRVNARPHVTIAKGDAAASGKPMTTRDLVRSPSSFSDLPLRGAVYTSRNPDGKVRLVVLFEGVEADAALTSAMVVAFDAKGSGKSQWSAEKNDLANSPMRAALLVDPGAYRVRIAATDAKGRSGTVDVETRAEIAEAGALKMSALVLGVPASGSFAPRLQFDAGDQQAIGYVEIYGVPKDAKIDVRFELAEADGGPALATGPAQLSNGPTEDTRIAFGGFGIGSMEAGDLLMRAVILLNDKPIGSVSRTMRKSK